MQLFPELDLFILFPKWYLDKSCYPAVCPQSGDVCPLQELDLDDKTEPKTTLSEPWFTPNGPYWGGKPREDLTGDPETLCYQISKF